MGSQSLEKTISTTKFQDNFNDCLLWEEERKKLPKSTNQILTVLTLPCYENIHPGIYFHCICSYFPRDAHIQKSYFQINLISFHFMTVMTIENDKLATCYVFVWRTAYPWHFAEINFFNLCYINLKAWNVRVCLHSLLLEKHVLWKKKIVVTFYYLFLTYVVLLGPW